MALRDVSSNRGLDSAVRELLDAAEPRDRAVHLLALRLAEQIEADPEALRDLAPKLLAVLDSVHATPKSRMNPKAAAPEVPNVPDALARLRASHRS